MKIPAGFGAGTATIVLKAEMNPARTSTVTLSLGGERQERLHRQAEAEAEEKKK